VDNLGTDRAGAAKRSIKPCGQAMGIRWTNLG
jgi:hypothetical protein